MNEFLFGNNKAWTIDGKVLELVIQKMNLSGIKLEIDKCSKYKLVSCNSGIILTLDLIEDTELLDLRLEDTLLPIKLSYTYELKNNSFLELGIVASFEENSSYLFRLDGGFGLPYEEPRPSKADRQVFETIKSPLFEGDNLFKYFTDRLNPLSPSNSVYFESKELRTSPN